LQSADTTGEEQTAAAHIIAAALNFAATDGPGVEAAQVVSGRRRSTTPMGREAKAAAGLCSRVCNDGRALLALTWLLARPGVRFAAGTALCTIAAHDPEAAAQRKAAEAAAAALGEDRPFSLSAASVQRTAWTAVRSFVEQGCVAVLFHSATADAATSGGAPVCLLRWLRWRVGGHAVKADADGGGGKGSGRAAGKGSAPPAPTLLSELVATAHSPSAHQLARANAAAGLCFLLAAGGLNSGGGTGVSGALDRVIRAALRDGGDAPYGTGRHGSRAAGGGGGSGSGVLRAVLEMLLSPSSRGAALDFMQAVAPLLSLPTSNGTGARSLSARRTAPGTGVDADLAAMRKDPIAGRRAAMPPPKEVQLPSLTGESYAQLLRPDALVEALRPGARNMDGSTIADEVYQFMACALVLETDA